MDQKLRDLAKEHQDKTEENENMSEELKVENMLSIEIFNRLSFMVQGALLL